MPSFTISDVNVNGDTIDRLVHWARQRIAHPGRSRVK